MGPKQLSGVIDIVGRSAAETRAPLHSEAEEKHIWPASPPRVARRRTVHRPVRHRAPLGRQDHPSADTRTVLGIALSAAHNGPVKGTEGYGVWEAPT